MRFYTNEECEEWLRGRERGLPGAVPGMTTERFSLPDKPGRIRYLCFLIAVSLTYRKPTLLWITEWGIWPSSENWHLYYKLRQSCADNRLLHEAPGHLFLEYETEDLASFLQLAMLNGWGGHLLTDANYVNAFFSHDEYIDFFTKHVTNLDELRKAFGSGKKVT